DLLAGGKITCDDFSMGIIGNAEAQRAWLRRAVRAHNPDPPRALLGLRLLSGFHQGFILLALFGREDLPDLRPGLRLHVASYGLAALLGLFLTQGPELLPAFLENLAEPSLLLRG